MDLINQGILFILSSPSGAGKTTIANLLIEGDSKMIRSISATTRPMRAEEVNNQDYFFLSDEEFKIACKNNEMLEHAKVFNYHYGTPKKYVDKMLAQGKDILCCIDWQGAEQITKHLDAVTIFLLTPSFRELRSRLYKRAADDDNTIEFRLKEAKNEIIHCNKYDYVIVNNVIEQTLEVVRSIVRSERAKVKYQKNLNDFIGYL